LNKRLKLIRQLGQTDCGAASLAMLMDYYGCKVDYPQFLTTLDIGRDGMSAAQIKAIAEENSFAVKIYKYNNLEDASQYAPFIICTQNNHYLVVETINDKYNKVTVLDPNGSREKVSIDILKKKSLNIAIVIEPKLSKYKTVKQKAFTGIKESCYWWYHMYRIIRKFSFLCHFFNKIYSGSDDCVPRHKYRIIFRSHFANCHYEFFVYYRTETSYCLASD